VTTHGWRTNPRNYRKPVVYIRNDGRAYTIRECSRSEDNKRYLSTTPIEIDSPYGFAIVRRAHDGGDAERSRSASKSEIGVLGTDQQKTSDEFLRVPGVISFRYKRPYDFPTFGRSTVPFTVSTYGFPSRRRVRRKTVNVTIHGLEYLFYFADRFENRGRTP